MEIYSEFSTNLDDELAKKQPDYLYEGGIPADNDALDFVNLPLKGARLA